MNVFSVVTVTSLHVAWLRLFDVNNDGAGSTSTPVILGCYFVAPMCIHSRPSSLLETPVSFLLLCDGPGSSLPDNIVLQCSSLVDTQGGVEWLPRSRVGYGRGLRHSVAIDAFSYFAPFDNEYTRPTQFFEIQSVLVLFVTLRSTRIAFLVALASVFEIIPESMPISAFATIFFFIEVRFSVRLCNWGVPPPTSFWGV